MVLKILKVNVVLVFTFQNLKKRCGYGVSDLLSVYSIEMTAIITALRWVEETKPLRIVICTDSMAVLQSFITDNAVCEDLVLEVKLLLLLNIISLGLVVQFCWVPGHHGIKGNEIADKLAKKTLESDQVGIHIPLGKGDTKTLIKSEVMLR